MMVHLQERLHTERFKALLDKYMPSWKERREQLNELVFWVISWLSSKCTTDFKENFLNFIERHGIWTEKITHDDIVEAVNKGLNYNAPEELVDRIIN